MIARKIIIAFVALVASLALAQQDNVKRVGTFIGSGGVAFLPPEEGVIVLDSVNYETTSAGTFRVIRPSATASVVSNGLTILYLRVDPSTGNVGAYVVTTNDHVLIYSPASGSVALRSVASIGSWTNTQAWRAFTLNSPATSTTNDVVYLAKTNHTFSRSESASTVRLGLPNQGSSFYKKPLFVEMPGAVYLNGMYSVRD